MAEVRATAVLPPDAPRTTAARVVAEVRDVSLADAPSVVVGEAVRVGAPLAPGGRLSFTIPVADVEPRRSYAVRVHVDTDGDGEVSPGDLLSTRAHPVLTGGAPAEAIVPLTLIRQP